MALIEISTALASVGSFILKYVEGRGEKAVDGTFQKLIPSASLVKANGVFLDRFTKELDSVIVLPTLMADQYGEALTNFLKNDTVATEVAVNLSLPSANSTWRLIYEKP